MPRERVRKTSRGQIGLWQFIDAYDDVKKGDSLRCAAKRHNMNHTSLLRYIEKRHASGDGEKQTMGYKAYNRVFTEEQGQELSEYLIRHVHICFDLPKKEGRKLAYELVKKHNLNRPKSWDDKEMAGEEWYRIFLRKNKEVSLIAERATSLLKPTGFSKNKVDAFYHNLTSIMNRHKFEPQDIYNTLETGITTAEKPDRVVTRIDCVLTTRRQPTLNSAEKSLVSVTFAANVVGNVVPPFFVFPRERYLDHFINDGPIASGGTADPSGWMQGESFMHFLSHFKKHTNVSRSHRVLLILDNQSLHIHIKALDFCKDNGIVLLSFPPHCAHRLHPLHVSVYGPFKQAVNPTCDEWIRSQPDTTMSIYDIPGIVASAMPLALTASNIQDGYCKTGIYPLNRELFTELYFPPAYGIEPNHKNAKIEFVPMPPPPPEDETPPLSPSMFKKEPLSPSVIKTEFHSPSINKIESLSKFESPYMVKSESPSP